MLRGSPTMLANARHEAFAHGLARGEPVGMAHTNAGYSPNAGNASRMNRDERIKTRVAELKALIEDFRLRSLQNVVLSREWVIEQLIGVVIQAKAEADFAGANKALHLLGLHLGMFVERKETGKPGDFDGLTIADKRERLLGIATQLGLGFTSEEGRRRFGAHVGLPSAVPK